MNNKMITIPYADAIEYGENTSALFKALWELTDLIRLESDLKKHHRAYLHVREDIDEKVKEARQIMTKVSVDMIGFYFKVDVPESSNSDENTPCASIVRRRRKPRKSSTVGRTRLTISTRTTSRTSITPTDAH